MVVLLECKYIFCENNKNDKWACRKRKEKVKDKKKISFFAILKLESA